MCSVSRKKLNLLNLKRSPKVQKFSGFRLKKMVDYQSNLPIQKLDSL